MKTQDIKKMGLAYVQVLEASKKAMDPVNPAELKGTHAQRKDKDIDNDGKVDSSDEYLHKRRQAISKSIKNEEVEQVDELSKKTLGSYVKGASGSAAGIASGMGRDIGAGKNTHPDDKRQLRNRLTGISKATDKLAKEETNWPVYSRILEMRDMHTKGATAAEPINSKASAGEKNFMAKHGGHDGNESGISGHQAAKHTASVATQNVKAAPARHNDQKIGDKSMPKPK